LRTRRPSSPTQRAASLAVSDRSSARRRRPCHCSASSCIEPRRISSIVDSSGSLVCSTRSARESTASSTASRKLVVTTSTTCGQRARSTSRPISTASVARCTSTGFVSNDAVLRRTANASTSSMSTTVCGRRAASSGRVSVNSLDTPRWLSPSMSLGNACGSISTNVVDPRAATVCAAACASPCASVVFPVPGGPAITTRPCGAPDRAVNRRPCRSTRTAALSSLSLVPGGRTIESHGPSWWSAGSTCRPMTP
jgi:hypothetical protein